MGAQVSPGEGGGFRAVVLDEDDHFETFDAVIFACSAPAMNRMLVQPYNDALRQPINRIPVQP